MLQKCRNYSKFRDFYIFFSFYISIYYILLHIRNAAPSKKKKTRQSQRLRQTKYPFFDIRGSKNSILAFFYVKIEGFF